MLNPLKIANIIGNRLVLWARSAKFEEQIASGVQVIGCCWLSKVILAITEHILMF